MTVDKRSKEIERITKAMTEAMNGLESIAGMIEELSGDTEARRSLSRAAASHVRGGARIVEQAIALVGASR